jgi:hypothetical protein
MRLYTSAVLFLFIVVMHVVPDAAHVPPAAFFSARSVKAWLLFPMTWAVSALEVAGTLSGK